MPKPARSRRRVLFATIALALASGTALVLAEIALRTFAAPGPPLGAIGYAAADGSPVADLREAAARGFIVPVPDPKPRERYMFAPGLTFYITYRDHEVLDRDWLDEHGRVVNRINSTGIRDREQVVGPKPAGQRRIVCLGDSFTYGWGIPVELGWVRRHEQDLRAGGLDVRTVNCGAAGTVCVDEYVAGLQHRFAAFAPDAVVLTLCLNDLIPSSGLGLIAPGTGLRLLDLALGAVGRGPLDLDPDRDWVQALLELPREQGLESGLYNADKPFEAMWSQGVPQRSLREAKAWCEARGLPFVVVIWPFLQGLGEGRHYPFRKMHELVAAECDRAGIPLLDVLPLLEQTDSEDLWVTPADPHPNPLAQKLALPAIAPFVRAQTGW